METKARTFLKALTWQTLGLITMSGLGYGMTGSWSAAGGFALASAGLGLALYVLHERLWARVAWGRESAQRVGRPISRSI